MQLRVDQLERNLKQGLAPVYLLAGDEPLFVQEALDAVRAAARTAGFDQREVLDVESGFDWGRLEAVAGELSLFGDRRLVELRLPSGKPGTQGAKAIANYCRQPPTDVVLIISCNALDGSQRKSAWVKAATQAGVFCYAWPLKLEELPDWLRARLGRYRLEAEPDALELLVERAEGNLLAAVQEIEKLRLLHGSGRLDLAQVQAAVADSARFDVFTLSDAALAGRVDRCGRIVRGLRAEGVDPTLILWALARDLRVLAAVSSDLAARRATDEAFWRAHKVFSARRGTLQQAAHAQPPEVWLGLLARCARIDRVIKGVAPGRAWDELIQLSTAYAARLARR